eukprot:GFUD01058877.1.p1 GENE.GFUD01058877.1~~GFUD01058877.1.p1  ORF type:complete len:108 (-),score=16.54 GFUD01058877.1:610-933(-)
MFHLTCLLGGLTIRTSLYLICIFILLGDTFFLFRFSKINLSFSPGEHTNYEEETDGNRTFSEGEGDTSRATDPDSALSPKKEKKKKGLRTPSFLKKKKKDKKEKEKA